MNYQIISISDTDGWIFISADDSLENPDAFVSLVKAVKESVNGEISSVGWMRYKISNIPFDLVFQWDDLFGIVIINNNQTEKEDVLHFLKNYGVTF